MPTDFRICLSRASPDAANRGPTSAAPHSVSAWTHGGTGTESQTSFRDTRSGGHWISTPDVDDWSSREAKAPVRAPGLQPSRSISIAPFAAPSAEASAGATASTKWAAHARASGQTSVPHLVGRLSAPAAAGFGMGDSVSGAGIRGVAGVAIATTGADVGSALACGRGAGAGCASAVTASSGSGCAGGGRAAAGGCRAHNRPAMASSALLRPSASVGSLPMRQWSAHGTRPTPQTPPLAHGRHSRPGTRSHCSGSPARGRRPDSPTRPQPSIWAAVAAVSSPGEADEIIAQVAAAADLTTTAMAGPLHLGLHRSASRRARSIAAAQSVARVDSGGLRGLKGLEQQLLSSLRRIPLLDQVLLKADSAADAQHEARAPEGAAPEATEAAESGAAQAEAEAGMPGKKVDLPRGAEEAQRLARPASRPELPVASLGRVAALLDLMQMRYVGEEVCSVQTLATAVQQHAEARILACVPAAAAVRLWSAEAGGAAGYPWTILRSHVSKRVGLAAEVRICTAAARCAT